MSNQNTSITPVREARESQPFYLYEDQAAPVAPRFPMPFMMANMPNVRAEIVTAVERPFIPSVPAAPSRVLQVIEIGPTVRTWSLESSSRQMHYDYERRSWYRGSVSITRSERARLTEQEQSRKSDSPVARPESVESVPEEESSESGFSTEEQVGQDSAVLELRVRKRDRFRRIGMSIVQGIKDLKKDKKGPQSPG